MNRKTGKRVVERAKRLLLRPIKHAVNNNRHRFPRSGRGLSAGYHPYVDKLTWFTNVNRLTRQECSALGIDDRALVESHVKTNEEVLEDIFTTTLASTLAQDQELCLDLVQYGINFDLCPIIEFLISQGDGGQFWLERGKMNLGMWEKKSSSVRII